MLRYTFLSACYHIGFLGLLAMIKAKGPIFYPYLFITSYSKCKCKIIVFICRLFAGVVKLLRLQYDKTSDLFIIVNVFFPLLIGIRNIKFALW